MQEWRLDKNELLRKNNGMKRRTAMAKVFITLTGTKYYHGNEFLKPGMKVKLTKEPDNEYDKEAIKVSMKGIGDIGHVANSSYTVIGDSMSAGRLYDKIGNKATAKVVLVTSHGTICKVSKKSLINWQIPPEMVTYDDPVMEKD